MAELKKYPMPWFTWGTVGVDRLAEGGGGGGFERGSSRERGMVGTFCFAFICTNPLVQTVAEPSRCMEQDIFWVFSFLLFLLVVFYFFGFNGFGEKGCPKGVRAKKYWRGWKKTRNTLFSSLGLENNQADLWQPVKIFLPVQSFLGTAVSSYSRFVHVLYFCFIFFEH